MAPADLGVAQAFADLAVIALAGRTCRVNGAGGALPATSTAGLAARVVIEQATGMLAERSHLTIAQAQARLHRHAPHPRHAHLARPLARWWWPTNWPARLATTWTGRPPG